MRWAVLVAVLLSAGRSVAQVAPVWLGSGPPPKPPAAVPVPLGAGAAASASSPRPSQVGRDRPSEECNRSSADWPTQPLRIGVLDFRYPVPHEEWHQVGSTGGGPGTAVADLIFARLETLARRDPRFAFSRGDRRRLDSSDFAGAARVGRQMGVDAVLAGTFVPVVEPTALPDAAPAAYEIRAGLVDTCTGQLLLRLSSVSCPQALMPGLEPAVSGAGIGPCMRFSVPVADVLDPTANGAAFQPTLDALLYPLEHNGTPPEHNGAARQGSAGVVAQVNGAMVTVRLPPGVRVAQGDQLAVQSYRLMKNPATYTLRFAQGLEIGRVTVTALQGLMATGGYTGSFPARAGDLVELVTEK